jgi:hypothetical protein
MRSRLLLLALVAACSPNADRHEGAVGSSKPIVRELSKADYLATFDQNMHRQGPETGPPFDFWPYVEAIPASSYRGFDCSAGDVEYAYKNSAGTFEHVLIRSDHPNVFMVIVLDLQASRVHGHRLLDLNEEYGLSGSRERP